jgi:hypothetical protein
MIGVKSYWRSRHLEHESSVAGALPPQCMEVIWLPDISCMQPKVRGDVRDGNEPFHEIGEKPATFRTKQRRTTAFN